MFFKLLQNIIRLFITIYEFARFYEVSKHIDMYCYKMFSALQRLFTVAICFFFYFTASCLKVCTRFAKSVTFFFWVDVRLFEVITCVSRISLGV